MKTLIIGLVILFAGGFLYSKFVQKLFRPDDRKTPAVKNNDGVDYVPMKKWKNAMINLLNIAGTGPIFGPIQGILFGPIAFITIPIGCVISGATHDYLCGMLSMRQDGAQMPKLIRKFLGSKIYPIYNFALCLFLLLLVAVFTYTPGDLFAGQILNIQGTNVWTWVIYGVILAYYIVATIFPIDKIIGKVYPILGATLLFSAIAILFGIFIKGYDLTELSFENGFDGIFNLYPLWNVEGNTGAGTAFFPAFFLTVACGITSGFHATQVTIIGRSVTSEKQGSFTFYWMMIFEGLIAIIWAAAAMGMYNAGSTGNATAIVGEVARDILGPVGGIIAIISVIILPVTTGDTALRSSRLILSEFFRIDQKKVRTRLTVTLCMLIPVIALLVFAKLNSSGFNILWRYFALANQTMAVFSFATVSVYFFAKQGASKFAFLVTLLPGTFYMFIVSSFIFNQSIGFGLPGDISYITAGVLSVAYFAGIILLGKKYAKTNIEE